MDFSSKMTIVNEPNQRLNSEAQSESSSSSVEHLGGFPCLACPTVLTTPHELTNHILSHNSPPSSDSCGEKEYTCGVCHKSLSSASSLTRHVYVHSGEKPFKCKYCEMAFSTNGNMNRHLRTAHREECQSSSNSCTDSDSSTDSNKPSRQADEYNNNEIAKSNSPKNHRASPTWKTKRKREDDEDIITVNKVRMVTKDSKLKIKRVRSQKHRDNLACPVCEDLVFNVDHILDEHLREEHPKFVLKCEICDRTFRTSRSLCLHNYMDHHADNPSPPDDHQNSVEGFHDLTHVDFSSNNFPRIAQAACEKSKHRPISGKEPAFKCTKCSRGFPCKTALEAHVLTCGNSQDQAENLMNENQSTQIDFFAGLNLQNRAAAREAREGRDLADIQSIITTASEPIFPRSNRSTPEQTQSNSNVLLPSSPTEPQEEAQDAFAIHFRKMKLKGEFPCRLCGAKFQNLRALKGHNRQHLNVPNGMPFPCVMCPYQHIERAALMKHLRDHNGDRPYECSLCNYAFTTKANCERHVRNRHQKQSRDEIKSVLIYHPNEDITNEGLGASPRRVPRDEPRRLSYPEDLHHHHQQQQQQQMPYPLEALSNNMGMGEDATRRRHRGLPTMIEPPISHYDQSGFYSMASVAAHSQDLSNKTSTEPENDDNSKSSEEGAVSLVSERPPEVLERLQESPKNLTQDNTCNDAPLDLSMDVLDLSKKSSKSSPELTISQPSTSRQGIDENSESSPQQTSNRPPIEENSRADVLEAAQRIILAQALMAENAQQSLNMYNNNPLMYSGVAFPGGSASLQSYLYNSHLFNQNLNTDRARNIARLQFTSGGSLIEPPNNNNFAATAYSPSNPLSPRIRNERPFRSSMSHSRHISSRERNNSTPTSNNNSVRMVIRNGVLVPKPKQKRYRTEKPFSCDLCDAKFTLRSNMERHVKHQHPNRWNQRPRRGHSTRGRPPTNPPTIMNNNLMTSSNGLSQSGPFENDKHIISPMVKNAILAQQLKGIKHEDNDSENEKLIIDEADEEKDLQNLTNNNLQPTMSLLRGKLEENFVKENEKKYEESSSSENIHNDTSDQSESPLKVKTEPEASDEEDEAEGDISDDKINKSTAPVKQEETNVDLASVSELLDNASQQYQQFRAQYMSDEEGLVASTSDCNNSDSDYKSDSLNFDNPGKLMKKKKMMKKKKKTMSAYSMAPNRIKCSYCERTFPWQSSLRRHILTHTGQKPFKCDYCSLLFTTKSNCDRHLLRKHKANVNKYNTTDCPSPEAPLDNNRFAMRNVPERPYKCNRCPSSTFSTLGNLKKHKSAKHIHNDKPSSPESPMSEPNSEQNESPIVSSLKPNDHSDDESQSSSISESTEHPASIAELPRKSSNVNTCPVVHQETPKSRRSSPGSSPSLPDGPFKCHLCESSFAVRQDCLDHIKDKHISSYELLMMKGALDMDAENIEDHHPVNHQLSDPEEKRGKFPDYSNRKVVCAFCMRRFWSAEDLRRHIRTHTGERPYSCDICTRKFTLKHSMLRHRKKHEAVDSTMYVGASGDEEITPSQPSTITPRSQQQSAATAVFNAATTGDPRAHERMSLPTVATVATGDAAPSGLMRFNLYEDLSTFTGRLTNTQHNYNSESTPDGDNDLISNLLGIRDRSIIEQVLQASADDAAKILGVKSSHD